MIGFLEFDLMFCLATLDRGPIVQPLAAVDVLSNLSDDNFTECLDQPASGFSNVPSVPLQPREGEHLPARCTGHNHVSTPEWPNRAVHYEFPKSLSDSKLESRSVGWAMLVYSNYKKKRYLQDFSQILSRGV